MTDLSLTRLWGMRAGFAVLVLVIVFFHLLPLDTTPRHWAGPDLILGFACAWCLRRPEYVPAWSLAGLFLLADLLLQRPPGLWALLALLGCENLKTRVRGLRDGGFAAEWLTVCVVIVAITLSNWAVLTMTLVDLPRIGLTLFELCMTLLFYPAVVAITQWGMGVRKSAPGDLDALGQRA
ncbi:rod shape-determining protein MreD [Sulfitobacter sabulilitoris]|uniref:Rod shape-determining protein MreD n=1 Tax=Sulfitobacter sabulilitoris TaxID=2562655 RepID=A0A5S3PDT7_9RHOB|nr:rod shape-determining protein MreD [Sulfitobacter sabulilitoris]TMM51119.1 rod shape-determining protein MreD [Sulfitobacter sabulilitoris]